MSELCISNGAISQLSTTCENLYISAFVHKLVLLEMLSSPREVIKLNCEREKLECVSVLCKK